MKQKLQRLKGGRLGSQLFLKTFMLLAFMLSGIGSVLAQETATWTVSAPAMVTCKATLNGTANPDVQNITATVSGVATSPTEINGKNMYKFNGDDAYIKLVRVNGSFHAGDKLKVTVGTDIENIAVGFRMKADGSNIGDQAITSNYRTVEYTLQSEDIAADGSISIYRPGGIGYACRFLDFVVECSHISGLTELSSNTDIVSVILGPGNWYYDSGRKGITNGSSKAPPSYDSDTGGYIVIRPKVNINFSLSTYSSQSNCNLRMYDDSNASVFLQDFRQKDDCINDFGILRAGKTYLIYGDGFKAQGNLEYIFFKSFTATASTCTNKDHTIYSEIWHDGGKTYANIGTGTDGFQTAFSQFYQLESGKQMHFTFKNLGGDLSWKSWYLNVTKSMVHSGDAGWDGQELLWVRADKFNQGDFHLYRNSMSDELNTGNNNGISDLTFIEDMKNASVDLTVSYADDHLFVVAKTTCNSGNVYYLTGVKPVDNGGHDVYAFLAVDQSRITNLYGEKRDVYKENLEWTKNNYDGEGTFKITNSADIDLPYYASSDGIHKYYYMASGEEIKIYATPKIGSTLNSIGSFTSGVSPRPFTTDADNHDFYIKFDKITDNVRQINAPIEVWNPATGKYVEDPNAGSVKIYVRDTDEEITPGSLIPVGTWIYLVAHPNPGYTFKGWSNGAQSTTRMFEVGSNSDATVHTFHVYFNKVSNFETVWSLKTPVTTVYSYDGTQWTTGGNWYDSRLGDGLEWTEVYTDANHTTPASGFETIQFNNKITIARQNTTDIRLFANGGAIRIPVTTAGEIVSFTINSESGSRDLTVINGGTTVSCNCVKNNGKDMRSNGTAYHIIVSPEAAANGYIELRNSSTSNIRLWDLKRSLYYDFAFEDGNAVLAYRGTTGYINNVVPVDGNLPLLEGGRYSWASSNPSVVAIDHNTGAVTIKDNFSGNVTITATLEAKDPYIANTKSYVLTTANENIYFDNTVVNWELGMDGSVSNWQAVKGVPTGYSVRYSVLSTDVKAEVTTDANGNGNHVTVFGAGTTVIQATCGALSATYTIKTFGFMFNEAFPVYDFSGSYTQKILGDSYTDVQYEVANRIGKIADYTGITVDENGTVSGLPSYDDNKGGSIIIHAWGLEGSVRKDAYYTLTVPYKKFTWNFYQENLTGNVPDPNLIQTLIANDHFKTGNVVNYTNPGAAGEVPMAANLDGVTYNANRADTKTVDGLKKRKTWMDAQNDDAVKADASDPHNYWNYTFKTIQREDDKKTIWYVNEPLFSYKGSVNGSNVAIVNETNGLIFNCAADKFGINDNKTYSTRDDREKDRAILIRGNSSFTVPFVQKGHYVKIHWYRHSDNSGDQFRVTNAVDLDGREINPDHVLRMTGSHYQDTRKEKDEQAVSKGYKGYTIVRAKETGDVTFTMANQGWTEIYTVEVTDEYSTELKVMHGYVFDDTRADNWGGPMNGGYGTRPNGEGEMVDMDTNIISVVRDVDNSEDYNESDLVTTDYQNEDSERQNHNKVNNIAKLATERVGKKPIIYIASYPGQTWGWNGWNLDVTATPMAEDAGNLSIGIKKDTWARLGNYLSYRYTALTNFHGTGTVHVVVRTKSNWEQNDGERYTLDMQEAYFPVGEYHSQKYPYTWDFTKYNMEDGKKLSGSNNYTATHMGGSTAANYGGWNNYAMQTHASVLATVPANAAATNHRTYNKFIFADGSQFTLNGTNANYGNVKYSAKPGANEIRETDGLRVNLGNMTQGHSYQDGRLKMDENYGGFVLPEGSSITIPKVNHGMYIYIRSAQKPTSVVAEVANGIQEYGKESSNTITSTKVTFSPNDNEAVVALHGNDVLDNVWVYRVIAGSATSETFDVTVTPSAAIEGIGVTKYHKETVQLPGINEANRMTDARNENIDYHNTGFFTKHDLQAYIATNVHDMGGSHNEDGLVNIEPITVLPAKANSGSDKRGLVLEKTANGTGLTSRPRLPLFVPACNVKDDELTGNLLVDCVASTDVPGYNKNSDNNIYILTNQHYDWDWEKNQWIAENVGATVNPGSLADGWHVDSQATFYILRDGGWSRPNFAYLEVPKTPSAGVKNFYMIQGVEFSDEEATGIEAVDSDAEVAGLNDASEVYTVTGVKVAKPTKKGLYVINGKKVYVK